MAHFQFICPFCKVEFVSPEQLRQHRLGNHRNQIAEVQPPPRKVRRKNFKQVAIEFF